jgi:hypothetical protein
MKKFAFAALAALTLAYAPSAQATTFVLPSANFALTNGTVASPSFTAFYFNSFGSTGAFDDTFEFTVPQDGLASVSVSTSFSGGSSNKLTFTDFIINGTAYALIASPGGQSRTIGDIPITSGVLNTIRVIGTITGSGIYTGTVTFTSSPVPEPASWAMMIGGFGLIGAAMRRRTTTVRFA